MKKGAALAAVLGVILGAWAFWFYSRPYDAVRLVQCLPSDRSLHVYMNVGLLRSAGILELLAGSQGAEEPDYKKFIEQTGFDYRTDLDAVAAGFRDGDEYFAVQGRFQWNRLAEYAQSHQGKCQEGTCSMPATQPGKTISFSLLRRDVLALAVARDSQASRVIFPGFWKEPPDSGRGDLGLGSTLCFCRREESSSGRQCLSHAAREGAQYGVHARPGSRSKGIRAENDRGLPCPGRCPEDGVAIFERDRTAQENDRTGKAQADFRRSNGSLDGGALRSSEGAGHGHLAHRTEIY